MERSNPTGGESDARRPSGISPDTALSESDVSIAEESTLEIVGGVRVIPGLEIQDL